MATHRTQITLDSDAAHLLDEQPPREGSRYLSKLIVSAHRRASEALRYLASMGWTQAELQAACGALNGTMLDHPMGRSSEAMAAEMLDALDEVRALGLGDTWRKRCEELARDPLQGPALAEVAHAYWTGEARTVEAVDTGKGLLSRTKKP